MSSAPGVKVNNHGYAVVPYLTPYGMNTVDIDPKGSSTDVEFESTSEQAVPGLGSVVMLKCKTVSGRAALIRVPQLDDRALPANKALPVSLPGERCWINRKDG